MRIIAGDARGIRLTVPAGGAALRPTEDRVKESLFSTLGELRKAIVLDLFSGTGALGLEALSRGAAQVILVERDSLHCEAIRQNLKAVEQAIAVAGHQAGVAKIVQMDVDRVFQDIDNQIFTHILADPPYHPGAGEYGALELVRDERLLAHCTPSTLLALEHATDQADLPWHPRSAWRLLRKRTFGIRSVSYATPAEQRSETAPEEFI